MRNITIVVAVLIFLLTTIKLLFNMVFYETIEEKRSELYDTAGHINMISKNKLSSLSLLMLETDISLANQKEVYQVLQGIYAFDFFKAAVYDSNGKLIAHTGQEENGFVNDLRAFQEAMSGTGSISSKTVMQSSDKDYVVFYVPIIDKNFQPRGVLAGATYLREINEMVNKFYSDANQCYVLTDGKGQLLNKPLEYPEINQRQLVSAIEEPHRSLYANDFLKRIFTAGFADIYLPVNVEYSSWRLVKVISAESFYWEILLAITPYLFLLFMSNFAICIMGWRMYQDKNKIKLQEKVRLERLITATCVAAGIAHEVKNPLTAIKGFIQIMLNKDKEKIFNDYLTIVLNEVERIELLLNQFATLARPSAKEKYWNFNLYELVQYTINFLEPNAKEKEISVNFSVASFAENDIKQVNIWGNPNQVKQVLINLLKNSIEASSIGNSVTVELCQKDQEACLKISDNGCGISQENLEMIGTPFFTTKENGTGLGMLISYEIIRRHNGKITIESAINKGTSFEIVLPIYK